MIPLQVLIEAARKYLPNTYNKGDPRSENDGAHLHLKGTCVTIEGPRFSSRCESQIFHSWGFDVINMTNVPEVILAKEAGLSYATLAIVTDYCAWKTDREAVSCFIDAEAIRVTIDALPAVVFDTAQ